MRKSITIGIFALLFIGVWAGVAYTVKEDHKATEMRRAEIKKKGVKFLQKRIEVDGLVLHQVSVKLADGTSAVFFCPCIQGSICWNCCADPLCSSN